jgi:predicted acylesterase/phospholipase RssA/CRP-like cAMP-binding protein
MITEPKFGSAAHPLADILDGTDVREIERYLQEHAYADGDTILAQGQPGDRFHILISGEADVLVKREIEVTVARLRKGHFFGEMSCLTGEAVSATVKAVGPVRSMSLSREGMFRLMDVRASFRRHMLQAMVQRIQDANRRVVDEHARSLVVGEQLAMEREIRFGTYIAGNRQADRLLMRIEAMSRTDDPLWIIGEEGTGRSHTSYEIHKRSARGEMPFVIVDGSGLDEEDFRIKRRGAEGGTILVRQADKLTSEQRARLADICGSSVRLVWTAALPPGEEARPSSVLRLAPLRERTEDIPDLAYEFLRRERVPDPENAISREAMRLLVAYPYLRGNVAELAKVVSRAVALSNGRQITSSHLRFGGTRKPGERPKVGLALGSGSVKGAAHVGVIKVLEEAGIPIHFIAGTSVGAFIGALYAGGQPVANFEKVLPTVRWRQLLNPALPPAALADNEPMARFVERFIGPVRFDELTIPFAAVASDAMTGEAYILNRGKVSRAICASTAIPGVMKPVLHEGRLMIDGGVVHPVPAALCRSMGADLVIAVDVSAPASMRRKPGNLVSAILNTIDIMSEKIVREELQLADIVLKPQLELQEHTFKSSGAFIRRGEEVTRQALADILRLYYQEG